MQTLTHSFCYFYNKTHNNQNNHQDCINVVQIDQKNNQVSLYRPNEKDQAKSFTFDHAFGAQTPQQNIYEQTAFSLVNNVLEGYNGTIFAYGQTGCGKTFTMMGGSTPELKGIIPRTFSQIVTVTSGERVKNYLVRCSFIQIYNEQIHDLLGKDIKARMELKESMEKGVFVKDLTMNIVKTTEEMEKYMDIGFKNRAVRETDMNKQSSRSHSIFTIYIQSSETDQKGNQKFKAGKLNLVDLAGSERQSKTNATGDGMKEAAKINLSLSALGNVISALVDGKTAHIPYRDSKLTRLLQDSLGGNTKTIMIAAVSPADYNFEETLSTLRYAARAKCIQNKPKINEDPKDTLLREYAEEIKKLKMMLEGKIPVTVPQVAVAQSSGSVAENKENNNNSSAAGLEAQLKSKEMQLNAEKEERARLAAQLQNLQKIMSKQTPSANNAAQMERIKKLTEKLQQQKQKEEAYLKQKRRREEELLNIEKNYRGLNEEVDVMKQRFNDIRKKYIASMSELRDIRIEHENQKQQLLDTIRFQQRELKRYEAVLNMILTEQQTEQIFNSCDWNQQKREYTVQPFVLKDKAINFPKLPAQQLKEMIESEKQKKQVQFSSFRDFNPAASTDFGRDEDSSPGRYPGTQRKPPKHSDVNNLKLNNILRDARSGTDLAAGSSTARSTSVSRNFQLQPLKNDLSRTYEEVNGGSNMERHRKLDPLTSTRMSMQEQLMRELTDTRKLMFK